MSKGESSSRQGGVNTNRSWVFVFRVSCNWTQQWMLLKINIPTVAVYSTPHWTHEIAIFDQIVKIGILLAALTETWSLWSVALLSVIDTTMGYNNLLVFSAKEWAVDGYNSKSVDCLTLDSTRLSTTAQVQNRQQKNGFSISFVWKISF